MKNLLITLSIFVATFSTAQTKSYETFSKSYAYENTREYNKAIQVLSTLPESSYSVQLRLGWLHYLNADYIKSKSHYKKAISINKSSIEARLGLIYPLTAISSWDEIIKVYNEILEIDINHTTSHYQLAYIYYVRKMYTQAGAHLKKVLELYPFDYNSNALLGSVYVKQGKIKEAKFHYTRAMEYNPLDTSIQSILNGL